LHIYPPPPGEKEPPSNVGPHHLFTAQTCHLGPPISYHLRHRGSPPHHLFTPRTCPLGRGQLLPWGGGHAMCNQAQFFPPCKQRAHEPAVVWASVPSFVPSVGAHCGFPLHQSPVPHQHPPHRWFESHVFKFAQIFLLYIINIINIFYISIIS